MLKYGNIVIPNNSNSKTLIPRNLTFKSSITISNTTTNNTTTNVTNTKSQIGNFTSATINDLIVYF